MIFGYFSKPYVGAIYKARGRIEENEHDSIRVCSCTSLTSDQCKKRKLLRNKNYS